SRLTSSASEAFAQGGGPTDVAALGSEQHRMSQGLAVVRVEVERTSEGVRRRLAVTAGLLNDTEQTVGVCRWSGLFQVRATRRQGVVEPARVGEETSASQLVLNRRNSERDRVSAGRSTRA